MKISRTFVSPTRRARIFFACPKFLAKGITPNDIRAMGAVEGAPALLSVQPTIFVGSDEVVEGVVVEIMTHPANPIKSNAALMRLAEHLARTIIARHDIDECLVQTDRSSLLLSRVD